MNELLSEQSISLFKKELISLKQYLIMQIYGKSNMFDSENSNDIVDASSEFIDKNINYELTGKEAEILRKVDRALEKISEGTYGVCDITGEPIPFARLEAIPYANMTIEAQKKIEEMGKF